MYPIFRFILEMLITRRKGVLLPGQVHHSTHLCWPWDVDPWRELNNGRTLTLYDLGRLPMADRTGMIRALGRNNWKMAVAGASVRYRRRVRHSSARANGQGTWLGAGLAHIAGLRHRVDQRRSNPPMAASRLMGW